MSTVERFAEGLDKVNELLLDPEMDPDPNRTDWTSAGGLREALDLTLRTEVLDCLDQVSTEIGDPAQVERVRVVVAEHLARTAAVLYATNNTLRADDYLRRAVDLAGPGERRAIFAAGRGNPAAFVSLKRAFWLRAQGRYRESRRLLKTLRTVPDPALRQAVEAALALPKPLTGAPSLFQLNGCGTGLHGSRDERPDGSYITTYFATLVWVPVVPIAAYRVRRLPDGNTYQFLSRERLGSVARGWLVALAVAAAGTGIAFGVKSYLESPARLARVGTAEAAKLEASGKTSEALGQYQQVAAKYGAEADVRKASSAVVRLASAAVHEPCTADQLGAVGRVVAAFEKLPAPAREGGPDRVIAERLIGWSGQIGSATPRDARAALDVLAHAERLAAPRDRPALHDKRLVLERSLADRLASKRPLDALSHYVQAGDPTSLEAAERILTGLGRASALWVEAAPDAEAWLKAVGGKHPQAGSVNAALDRARKEQEALADRLEKADPGSLIREQASAFSDQTLAVAVARSLRAEGDAEGCLRLLQRFGGPGLLIGTGQQVVGACLADLGRYQEAADVLGAYLDEHLVLYQRALSAYDSAQEATRNAIVKRARDGGLPEETSRKLEAAPEEKRGEIFRTWLNAQLDLDENLRKLGAEYLRHSAVVPSCLTLGMVELQQSRGASGEERRARLDAAERAFLAIREEAQGAPAYHVALGQVYHRLGKTAEGDKELSLLLASGDVGQELQAAEAYRELGIETRTREILEKAYASAKDDETRQAVAFQRVHAFRDLEDREAWLQRSDAKSEEVRLLKLENDAQRHLAAGRDAEADRAFAQSAAALEQQARHNSASANNAALALLGRYAATGDLSHRQTALRRLEAALRLAPDNAIVHGNLAGTLEETALIQALGSVVHVRALRLRGDDAQDLYATLVRAGQRDRLLEALKGQPEFLRAKAVAEQEQVLAPKKRSTFLMQRRWLDWFDDGAGLRALADRLRESPPELGASQEARDRWRSGKDDASWRRRLSDDRSMAGKMVERARKEGHAPTIASALVLLATAEEGMSILEEGTEPPERAVAACREAVRIWPEGGLEDELADALLLLGAEQASRSEPSWKAIWKKARRESSLAWLIFETAQDPKGAQAVAVLKARPEVAECLSLKAAISPRRPEVGYIVLARALGDARLEAATRGLFSRAAVLPSVQIALALEPDGAEEKGRLALVNGGPRP